jgi:uncharacterized membrane protein YhdT
VLTYGQRLNTVYVIAVVLVALAGTLFVASVDSSRSTPRWLEWSSVAAVLLFTLLVGVQLLV